MSALSYIHNSVQKLTKVSNQLTSWVVNDEPSIQDSPFIPRDSLDYWNYRRYMHDVLVVGLWDVGLYTDFNFTIDKIGLASADPKVSSQVPDLYRIENGIAYICEVTITTNKEQAAAQKKTKYVPLFDYLSKNDIYVDYNMIILDMTNPEWADTLPVISSHVCDLLTRLIDNLRIIHSDPRYRIFRKDESHTFEMSRFDFSLSKSVMADTIMKATGVSQSDVDPNIMEFQSSGLDLDMTDDQYIRSLAVEITTRSTRVRPTPSDKLDSVSSLKREFQKLPLKPTTTKIPKILSLGVPTKLRSVVRTYSQFILDLRKSTMYGGYFDYVKQSLESVDPNESDHLITLALPSDMVEHEQREGPGRKSWLRKNGIKTARDAPTHIGVKPHHEIMLQEFISQLSSEVESNCVDTFPSESTDKSGDVAENLMENMVQEFNSDPSSTILWFYQVISNEIVLNSMRRRKTREYALCDTGFDGILILVAPGPQLRTESNVEFIKIISSHQSIVNPLSAKWNKVGNHYESKWLSVDTDRLKHWQRAYDRVALSVFCNAERLVSPGMSMLQATQEEISNKNSMLLTLTYIEDKSLTSTTNQTIRYLWMKSLGDRQFEGLASKFPERVGSVIQSVFLTRSFNACEKLLTKKAVDWVNPTKIKRDETTGLYDETTTGSMGLVPRLITKGGLVPVSYSLNEIYWCMAYNKDRQNKAQDSLKILKKILKEESKYNEEINKRTTPQDKVNYFLGRTSLSQDIDHAFSDKPESHFYSARAVRCGIELQDKHPENFATETGWLNDQKIERILGKNLSEFATFKASVKDICHRIDPNDLSEIKKLAKRTKAIELVSQIVCDEDLLTASQVAMTYSGDAGMIFEILIQIFKKNQIGGTREIIILFIKARIMFNIVEEIARLLCKSDSREILTKGRDKRLMMRGDFESVLSSFPKDTPIKVVKESYDMTSWCQKFIPTIFIPIHNHHLKSHRGLLEFSQFLFLKHSNKIMEFPKNLVELWIKHPSMVHNDKPTQDMKTRFLETGSTSFRNFSNMCQGIPHYNSSVLALSCLSLRDRLFEECLKVLGKKKTIVYKSRVGSDDKGTMIGVDLSKPDSYYQYILLGQCELVSERLHSMELSVKSASGTIMYELNSSFMCNLETLSPTIKFSLAAVDTISTSSSTEFVNESYSRIRQLRENGGSSILCSLAHSLNSRHFYNVFATGHGQVNDVTRIFSCPQSKIPYDFGVYPTYDIDLQDILGPEFYNYQIYKKYGPIPTFRLLYTDVPVARDDEVFTTDNDPLLKKDHFGITQGLVRQLENMRTRLSVNPEETREFFTKNPYLIIRGPVNKTETKHQIHSKLLTKGASTSLRHTSAAIYIGRLSAFRASTSWRGRVEDLELYNLDKDEMTYVPQFRKMTYSDYLKSCLANLTHTPEQIKTAINVLFPQSASYDLAMNYVGKFSRVRTSAKRFSQAVRTWTVNNHNYDYKSSLRDIIETSFGQSDLAPLSDVLELKSLMGFSLTSLDQFTEECLTKNVRPMDIFFTMRKIYKLSQTTRIQAYGFGPSTNTLHMTIRGLKTYNHIAGKVSLTPDELDEEELENQNTLFKNLVNVKLCHNLIVMARTGMLNVSEPLSILQSGSQTGSIFSDVLTTIRSLRTVNGLDYTTKKALMICLSELASPEEIKETLLRWKHMNFSYLKRQKKNVDSKGMVTWTGDLSVLVSTESDSYLIKQVSGKMFIECEKILSPFTFFESLRSMSKTLNFNLQHIFTRQKATLDCLYLSSDRKQLFVAEYPGNMVEALNVRYKPKFGYKRLEDMDTLSIDRIFNHKSKSMQVLLKSDQNTSVTICHTTGSLYAIRIPKGFSVNPEIRCLGVGLNMLFKNRDWFFNYSLTQMSSKESVEFFLNQVDMSMLKQYEAQATVNLKSYLESLGITEEDAESYSQSTFESNRMYKPDEHKFGSESINELFRRTILDVELPSDLIEPMTDWAEIMEDEDELETDAFNLLKEESTEMNSITRAFGYKKPTKRQNMITITQSQLGPLLKNSCINLIFDGDINGLQGKRIMGVYKYFKGTDKFADPEIREEILRMCVSRLSILKSTSQTRIRTTLDSNLSSIEPLYTGFLNELENQTDVWDLLDEKDYDTDDSTQYQESEFDDEIM